MPPEKEGAVRICCGPRCGTHPGHRLIYRQIESATTLSVEPILCQGWCGNGVTVVLPDGAMRKILDTAEARQFRT